VDHYLLNLPPNLPEGIFIIATVRRGVKLPLRIECDQDDIEIEHDRPENVHDIDEFLESRVSRPKIRKYIHARKLGEDAFVELMREKSEGNFMYLRYVLPEIEEGTYEDLDLKKLPVGLQNYYEDHWQRMGMMAKPRPDAKIKIVYVLSEICEPVSRQLIVDFADESEVLVQEVLDEWAQFLHRHAVDGETRFSVYHDSFRDFLNRQDIVQAAGVSRPDINTLILDKLLSLYDEVEEV